MTGKAMKPLGQNRMTVMGAVKIGVKSGRAMKAIDTFRFLSNDVESLEALATAYGGEVKPFSDPKSSWRHELISNSGEIAVILPPFPLGDGPMYEKFGGKGIERRCDGTMCEVEQAGPDGKELVSVPCICPGKPKADQCRGTTRLNVILPQARMAGVWQLVTKSEFAADELSTMVRMIEQAGALGLTEARLKVDPRQTRGGANKFKVPILLLNSTIAELMAGAGQLTGPAAREALTGGTQVAIGPGGGTPTTAPGSGVVDAEVITPAVRVAELWGEMSDDQKAAARAEQQQVGLPPKIGDMNDEEAQRFIDILLNTFN